ncbi:hypothetical protein AGRA3207_005016 [Actinomadura graeca]|uniref:Uncharacterized protein n=1 Tax=Actinomadura graeca TaxID=2750812 RepID=A0ABX8QYG2_9ACTN|nr:hypothetical protein [Actinomadura graeca]QXJ23810.1 hypothetical protein AGRA3207_005016 [Actinomadura graeca]
MNWFRRDMWDDQPDDRPAAEEKAQGDEHLLEIAQQLAYELVQDGNRAAERHVKAAPTF